MVRVAVGTCGVAGVTGVESGIAVVGVGVVPDQSCLADELFIIPVEYFGHGGVCMFTEKDAFYGRCVVTVAQLEQKILALAGRNPSVLLQATPQSPHASPTG